MTKQEAVLYLQKFQTTLRGDEGKLICALGQATKSLISEISREICSQTAIMSLEDFYKMIKSYSKVSDYIVRLKYKYTWESEYTYSNEYLEWEYMSDWVWLNDWNEGQTDCYVVDWVRLEDVFSRRGYHNAD